MKSYNPRRTVRDVRSWTKLNNLSNAEYVEAFERIYLLSERYSDDINNDGFTEMVGYLGEHIPTLDIITGRGRKNELTDYIVQYQTDRSHDLRVIDQSVKTAGRNRKRGDLVAAANYIQLCMHNKGFQSVFKNRDLMSRFLDDISKLVTNDGRFIEAMGLLDLSQNFNDMMERHSEFKATLLDRYYEHGKENGDVIDADAIRRDAQTDLDHLMGYVELEIRRNSSSMYKHFLSSLDNMLSYDIAKVNRRAGKNSKNEETESKDNVDTTSMEQKTGMEGENQPAAASETKVGTQASPQRKGVMTLPIAGAELPDSSAVPQSTPEEPQEIEEPTVSTGSEGTDEVDTKSA